MSTEAPQSLPLGMDLSAMETGSNPPCSSQTAHLQGQAGRPGAGRILRGNPKMMEQKGSAEQLSGRHAPLSQDFLWERPHRQQEGKSQSMGVSVD